MCLDLLIFLDFRSKVGLSLSQLGFCFFIKFFALSARSGCGPFYWLPVDMLKLGRSRKQVERLTSVNSPEHEGIWDIHGAIQRVSVLSENVEVGF